MKTNAENSSSKEPKLEERLRNAIRLRQMSARTEETYVQWYKRFVLFHGKRHPKDMGNAEVGQFLTHLAAERDVAVPTQKQALQCAGVPLQDGLGN